MHAHACAPGWSRPAGRLLFIRPHMRTQPTQNGSRAGKDHIIGKQNSRSRIFFSKSSCITYQNSSYLAKLLLEKGYELH